jgi:NADH-quinone oxidoreductase subunit M
MLDWRQLPPYLSLEIQKPLFLTFVIGCAILLPVFPIHNWFVRLLENAPKSLAILCSALFPSIAVYLICRLILPLFPEATAFYAPYISSFSVFSVLYFSCQALVQKDLNKTLSYLILASLSIVLFALFSMTLGGIQGAFFQIINIFILSSLLFLGRFIIKNREAEQGLDAEKGMKKEMPIFCFLFTIALLSMMRFPGIGNLTAEILIFFSTFESAPYQTGVIALSLILLIQFLPWLILQQGVSMIEKI